MCLDVHKFAFLYSDYEYFQWFKQKTKSNLENVIRWKGLQRTGLYDKIQNRLVAGEIHNSKYFESFRPVTRAFLHHLNEPTKYPILDFNAFEAFKKLANYETSVNAYNCKWERDYLCIYTPFFEKFYKEHKKEIDSIKTPRINGVSKEIIKRRNLDRSLWEYGRMLKKARLAL